jgi:RNA polymerase sigma factor for flagellar operon FliA
MSEIAAANDHALTPDQSRLVEAHLSLVRAIASRWRGRCRSSVDHQELVQAGALGLMDAARRFDPERGPFVAIASQRIKGAIGDYLRDLDPLSRDRRASVRALREAAAFLRNKLGREPEAGELACKLRWSHDAVDAARTDLAALDAGWAQVMDPSSCDEIAADDTRPGSESPLKRLLENEMVDRVESALSGLTERERLVMDLYYRQELTMHEVGEVLGVTESRVSQIHSAAVVRLRKIVHATTTTDATAPEHLGQRATAQLSMAV